MSDDYHSDINAEGFEGNGAPMILSPKGKFTISPRNKTKSGGLGIS